MLVENPFWGYREQLRTKPFIRTPRNKDRVLTLPVYDHWGALRDLNAAVVEEDLVTDKSNAPMRSMNMYDEIAADLQQLRFSAGDISYAEIVRRIANHRELGGIAASAARPARTTVYDAFRVGRTRVNPQLVGEIARVLGASEGEVAKWEYRCLQARRNWRQEMIPVAAPEPALPQVEIADDALPGKYKKLMLFVACVGLNVLGFTLVSWLSLPLYLDMVGTAIAAIVLGPWLGVAVGLSTNAIGLSITDSSSIAFGAVNIVGALVWGYGARRLRLCQSFPRYLLLNTLVALCCTVVASTLLVVLFNGGTGHASEFTTHSLTAMGSPLALAVLQANLVHSLTDKLVTGFVVLGALGTVHRWYVIPLYEPLHADVTDLFERVFRHGAVAHRSC